MAQPTPRFRRDLAATATEADGVAFVDVSDARTGTTFRLYDFEYQLALQLDGRPVEDVVAWASSAYGLDLTPEGITEFSGRLGELGFLEADAATGAARPAAPEAPDLSAEAEAEWLALQNARTNAFVPDAEMLAGVAQDL